MSSASTPLFTAGFVLSKLGKVATERFGEQLRELGLRPRHCGLLAAVAATPNPSQEDLGRLLGTVPSAIVSMVDDLEQLGALKRVLDPDNRRRHSIALTRTGQSLFARASELARQLDAELLAPLSSKERVSPQHLLTKLAVALPLPMAKPARGA